MGRVGGHGERITVIVKLSDTFARAGGYSKSDTNWAAFPTNRFTVQLNTVFHRCWSLPVYHRLTSRTRGLLSVPAPLPDWPSPRTGAPGAQRPTPGPPFHNSLHSYFPSSIRRRSHRHSSTSTLPAFRICSEGLYKVEEQA